MFRFAVPLGLLDRPLAAAFVLILLTGEIFPVLYVAIFFELLWIDLIPAGTFIPPNAVFCLVATTALIVYFQLESIEQIFFLMLLTIPGAYMLSLFESWHRVRQNKSYNLILRQSRDKFDSFQPEKMIFKSMAGSWGMNFLAACVGLYLLTLIFPLINILPQPDQDILKWPHLLMIASISAIAALRIRKAYTSLILAMLIIAIFLAWKLWPGLS